MIACSYREPFLGGSTLQLHTLEFDRRLNVDQ